MRIKVVNLLRTDAPAAVLLSAMFLIWVGTGPISLDSRFGRRSGA